MDMLISMGIALVIQGLKEAIKNPTKKEELKKAMFKVYTQIGIAYPEFNEPPSV